MKWLPGAPLCATEAPATPNEPNFMPADASSDLTWKPCLGGFYSLSLASNELVIPQLAAGQAVQIQARALSFVFLLKPDAFCLWFHAK